MAGAVGRGTGAGRLAAFAEIFRLTAERPLIDAPGLGAGKRQAHVLELEDRLGTLAAHVFDGVLVTDVVRPLDGVVHVPAPVVVRIVTGDSAR